MENDTARRKKMAAVCAAIAEELGTDVSSLRVLSFKKIDEPDSRKYRLGDEYNRPEIKA